MVVSSPEQAAISVIIIIDMTFVGTPPHHVLAADSRAALLHTLRGADRPLTIGEAAAAVGIGESTARFHLALLVSAGLVTRTSERRASAGRPALRYAATDLPERDPEAAGFAAVPASTDRYEQLASVLAGHMERSADPLAAARAAGERWSAELAHDGFVGDGQGGDAMTTVVDLMTRLGFDPERGADAGEIRLHTCPFEAVARQHRAVVCGVHLGMLEQTLAELGGDTAVEGLEPFVTDEPLLCVLRLAAAAARRGGRPSAGDG